MALRSSKSARRRQEELAKRGHDSGHRSELSHALDVLRAQKRGFCPETGEEASCIRSPCRDGTKRACELTIVRVQINRSCVQKANARHHHVQLAFCVLLTFTNLAQLH